MFAQATCGSDGHRERRIRIGDAAVVIGNAYSAPNRKEARDESDIRCPAAGSDQIDR